MKRILIPLAAILFYGCSYTGHLEKGFHIQDQPIRNKINLSVALLNTQELKDSRIQEYTGNRTFTFYINPAFNEELVKELRNVFSDVQIIDTAQDLSAFNIQVIPTLSKEYIDGIAWTAQYRYRITTGLTFSDTRLNNIIDEFKYTDDLIVSPSPADTFLGILTGLSLFILSPITIPLQTQVGGENATRILEECISRSFRILSYKTANSKNIYNYYSHK
jgi:hypothetical protein